MGENTEKRSRGIISGKDSPKTLIERAKREVPGFPEQLPKSVYTLKKHYWI